MQTVIRYFYNLTFFNWYDKINGNWIYPNQKLTAIMIKNTKVRKLSWKTDIN